MTKLAPSAYLVDSNAFLWLLDDDRRLKRDVATLLDGRRTPISLSVASVWEIEIKHASGKLRLDFDILEKAREFEFPILDITAGDAVMAAHLPTFHRDPFDRMIVAQAKSRGLTLITSDTILLKYGIPILWAEA